MRRDKRSRNGPFLENRRFSAHVRDLIRDGRAEEARAKCEKQARRGPALRRPAAVQSPPAEEAAYLLIDLVRVVFGQSQNGQRHTSSTPCVPADPSCRWRGARQPREAGAPRERAAPEPQAAGGSRRAGRQVDAELAALAHDNPNPVPYPRAAGGR